MERSVFVGVLAEITMKAKILRAKLKDDPDSVCQILESIERLEDELFEAIFNFELKPHK